MATTTTFSGISSYANDLQQVITRAVAIASMPLNILNNQRDDMSAQGYALNALDAKFAALQEAIGKVDSALSAGCFSAVSSDPSSVSVSVGAGATEGEYTVNVLDAGSSTVTISNPGLAAVADPDSESISAATTFTLTVGGHSFEIAAQGGSLTNLARAINDAVAGVHAAVVNTGSSSSPQYRLMVRADSLGSTAIQLREGALSGPAGVELLDTLSTGTKARYTIQGLADPIESDSRTVVVTPGLTVNLLRQTTDPVTVTVASSTDSLEAAISGFVDAYNAATTQLDQQVGESAGALSGRPIVRSLFASLRGMTQYNSGSGAVPSLARMGIDLDRYGMLSFDASKMESRGAGEVAAFLGSVSGGGFLKAARDAIVAVEDSDSGSVTTEIKLTNEQIKRQDDVIAETERQIADLQTSLQDRMAEADALLASLESKRDYMNNLFTAMMKTNATTN
jgi:flagellar hook-associated protein 2